MLSADLRALARLHGVQLSYVDTTGTRQIASHSTVTALLGAMGVEASSTEAISESLTKRRQQLRSRWLPPCAVLWDGSATRLRARLPQSRCQLRIDDENGTRLYSAELSSERFVDIPELPTGYYSATVEHGDERQRAWLLSAPTQLPAHPQTWGVFAPLYAMRGAHSRGASFAELGQLAAWTSELGGGAVATLPLLSAFFGRGDEPCELSPYRPVSRQFWNEAFLDIRACRGFDGCREAQDRLAADADMTGDLLAERDLDLGRLAALRRPVLQILSDHAAAEPTLRESLERYVRSQPRVLEYARFRAATVKRGPWSRWASMDTADIAADDPEVRYHLYVQWQLDEQLAAITASSACRLYLDLPVGVHPDGFDAFVHRDVLCLDAEAGAPPDALNAGGQCWALPVLHPERIRTTGHRYWRDCVRAQLRHAGVLRIDHVMGLHRMFWVPRGASPREGAYVLYPAQEQWAVVCIEAARASAAVVGENLGTVPPAVDATIDRHRCHGMSVGIFSFGGTSGTTMFPPTPGSVASLGTHDTPSFAGFLAGGEIDVQHRLGFIDDGAREHGLNGRRALFEHLRHHFAPGCDDDEYAAQCIHDGLLAEMSASDAWMVLVTLEDLWLEPAPQNIPGTPADEGNWSRRLARSVDEITADASIAQRLRDLFRNRLPPSTTQ